MAKNLQIVCNDINVDFNCKYEKLDGKSDKPKVIAKAPNGNEVRERSVYDGQVILSKEEAEATGGKSLEKKWVDNAGVVYAKAELSFVIADTGEQVSEISETKIMTIDGFQDVANYTDSYVIDKYYEIYPSDNGLKKDFDRNLAVMKNKSGMRKLWEHLKANGKVARGELCVSSRGFLAGDAYIRALEFQNKWGLEIGIFKEEKIYSHLEEGIPEIPEMPAAQKATKRLKMV